MGNNIWGPFAYISRVVKLKILYISPINTVGTLDLWKTFHESKGNQCEYITLFKSPLDVNNGICLNLP